MRIIKHEAIDCEGWMFTDIIQFKFPEHPLRIPHSVDPDLNRVCDWLANTFRENYIVMEMLDRRIAGGWGDHAKQSWEDAGSVVDRSADPYPSHYELRCYSKDATLFLLRWS